MKTRIQDNGEPMKEFAMTIKQLTQHAFPSPDEDHVHRDQERHLVTE
jgi:hypothetical protein